MRYLLDTDVFIRSKNVEYGFDFCPAFWSWLDAKNAAGIVHSIANVGDELRAGGDVLAAWAEARGPSFFLEPTPALPAGLSQVSAWVVAHGFPPSAQSVFFQAADYFLVSQALVDGLTVVTHEVPGNSQKRVKIPDVCLGLGVRVLSPSRMLRAEHARFVLGADGPGVSL